MENKREFYIGLDLGGTFLKYALGEKDGTVLFKNKTPSHGNEKKTVIFKVIFTAISELIEIAKQHNGIVKAIGVGTPGVVDFDNGKLLGNTPNMQDWGDANIRKEVEGNFNIPTWADNDANLMALAEARIGAARGHGYVICLTLGTGIGGGILLDGKVYRGHRYAGAELGHTLLVFNGRSCNCGGFGCFEQYASAPAMVRGYKELLEKNGRTSTEDIDTVVIFERAKEGDTLAQEIIDQTSEYLGAGMASIANALNPQVFVVGGGVADAGDEFIKKAEESLLRRVIEPAAIDLKVVRATLGNDAGIVGAILLAAEMSR